MPGTTRVIRRHLALGLVFGVVCLVGVGTGAWGSSEAPPRSSSGDAAHSSGDRWAVSYTREQFAGFTEELSGHYVGVGLWVVRRPSGEVDISRVLPGGPAAVAGVTVGDRLLRIGSAPVDGLPVTEVVALLRDGGRGSAVQLTIRHDGGVRQAVLRREVLDADDVTVDRLAGGVTRISVDAFTEGVGERVAAAVRRARSGAGILLDLRGNSGGLVQEAVATASVFLDGGPVARYRPKSGGPTRMIAAAGGGDTTTPLVVLVDGGTMSAAELLTGALQDRGRAVVVGSPTFGKGAVQQPAAQPDGRILEHTVGTYLTPDGRDPSANGLAPDVVVPSAAGAEAATTTALGVLGDLAGDDGATR